MNRLRQGQNIGWIVICVVVLFIFGWIYFQSDSFEKLTDPIGFWTKRVKIAEVELQKVQKDVAALKNQLWEKERIKELIWKSRAIHYTKRYGMSYQEAAETVQTELGQEIEAIKELMLNQRYFIEQYEKKLKQAEEKLVEARTNK